MRVRERSLEPLLRVLRGPAEPPEGFEDVLPQRLFHRGLAASAFAPDSVPPESLLAAAAITVTARSEASRRDGSVSAHGETDDFCYNIARDPAHVHDLFQGRQHRPADMHGRAVDEILA